MQPIHATCVALDTGAVLLLGPSGSGKSDLALRLIDAGARLVADDGVFLTPGAQGLVARAPAPIAGLMEVRGLGVVRVPSLASAVVRLAVELCPGGAQDRIPDAAGWTHAGISVPFIVLDAWQASAAARVRLAMTSLSALAPDPVTAA